MEDTSGMIVPAALAFFFAVPEAAGRVLSGFVNNIFIWSDNSCYQ